MGVHVHLAPKQENLVKNSMVIVFSDTLVAPDGRPRRPLAVANRA